MKFEMSHKVGEQKVNVTFKADIVTLRLINIEKLKETFQRLGGVMQDDYSIDFPLYINSQVIEEIIRNTCFVCGGLMKDGTAMVDQQLEFEHDIYGTVTQQVPGYAKQIKVRKCTSCGHSHT